MRKSVIKEIFSGKRGTYQDVNLSDEYKESESKMFRIVDAFIETLTPEQKESFNNAYEYISDRSAAYAADHYAEGFKLGLLIGLECRD